MDKILIVDDDKDICVLLEKYFTKKGFETLSALSGKEAIKKLKKSNANLVILDFKLPDYTGIEILQKIKVIDSNIQVIIITGYSDVGIAVDALKKGAYDYVTKPLYPDEILLSVQKALSKAHDEHKQETSPKAGKMKRRSDQAAVFITGKSPQSLAIQKQIDLIAPTDMSVIILGETGTGKEYVARQIHKKSRRANQAFIAIDCGALPTELAASELFGHVKGAFTGAINDKKGCFELANQGTLFLDEIGNLSYENQVKLLRVLQDQMVKRVGGTQDISVDVRVLAASNDNFREAVKSGDFREDIYHRLNEFRIELSPLRERPADIELFAMHFLSLANQQLGKNITGFEDQTLNFLMSHYWHGNLRELNNVVKRAVLLCDKDRINQVSLPSEIIGSGSQIRLDGEINNAKSGDPGFPKTLKEISEQAEKSGIIAALKKTNFNKTETAKLLDVDRKTLYNKIKAYSIDV